MGTSKLTLLRNLYKYSRNIQHARSITIHSEHRTQIPDDKSFAEYMLERIEKWTDNTAMIDATTGESCSYTELAHKIRNTAAAFAKRGLKQNDVVCFLAPNCIHHASGLFATNLAGGVYTGLNPSFTESELVNNLTDAGASVVTTIPEVLPKVENIAKLVKSIKEIYIIGPPTAGFESMDDFAKENDLEPPKVKVNPNDVAAFFYSSGTTGRPKATMLSNYSMISNVDSLSEGPLDTAMYPLGNGVVATVFPFYHIGGSTNTMSPVLRMGNTLIVFRTFEFVHYLETLQKHKVSIAILPPNLLASLAKEPVVRKYDLSSLKTIFSGAATVNGDMLTILQHELNIPETRTVYGLTEASGITHGITKSMLPKASEGSVGKLFPNKKYKIVDINSGKEMNYGETGEVWMKGPVIMKGYLNNPEATAEALTQDGWLKTGDIGYAAEDGALFIVDRLKDMIKCKGFQVAPAELEDVLLSHPAVADVGVIGVPHEKFGEAPRAFVVAKAGTSVTEEELHDHMKEKLAPYKRLTGGLVFVDQLPRNPTGKVLRKVLREQYL